MNLDTLVRGEGDKRDVPGLNKHTLVYAVRAVRGTCWRWGLPYDVPSEGCVAPIPTLKVW